MSKLVLGTSQFGLNYGINNIRGIIPEIEVKRILELASRNGIDTIDTAKAYGKSEAVLGSCNLTPFNVITKINKPDTVHNDTKESLVKLGIKQLYALLIHNFSPFESDKKIWSSIQLLKTNGLVCKIGFSLNKPDELNFLLDNNIMPDIIQIPYSVFDQRFGTMLEMVKSAGIEVHTRSVFLQGLYFMDYNKLPSYLIKLKPKLEQIEKLATDTNISIGSLCLNFPISNKYIDKVVIGIDSISNLQENILSLENLSLIKNIHENLIELAEKNENLILPMNWPK
jgi:aryl-alcohol dehydrogenase-like predicted oxidoreductase